MMNTKKISLLFGYLITLILPVSGDDAKDNINRRTFLLKNNAVFSQRLDSFKLLLRDTKASDKLQEFIKASISEEIEKIDDLARFHYDKSVLPLGMPSASPLASGEHYSQIKSILDRMKAALMGFNTELESDAELDDILVVIQGLIKDLDQQLDQRVSDYENYME